MFDAGAAALDQAARIEPSTGRPPLYLCPICTWLFVRDDAESGRLTIDHVPPESIDGTELVLTCERCNNTAGNTIDDQANLQNRSRRFLKRAPGRYPVSLDPGVDALMTITTGEPPYLHVKEQHSHPDLFRRLLADTHAGKPVRGYYPISFNEREAHLSLLRAAYLVVFAVWGYQLILSPSYDRVRRQLQRIDETAISSLPVGVASASEKSVFMSYLPDLGAAIVVRFGDRWVALPKVGTDDEWWDRTDHAVTPGKTVDLPVLSRPGYPKFPLYLCDRQFDPSAATDWRPIERFGNPPST